MKYFHNNIDGVHSCSFEDVDFRTVYMDCCLQWDLPSSCAVIIRATDPEGLITEHSYKSVSAAKKKLHQLKELGCEVLLCDQESIVHI
jgi:hypothetical protein